MRFLTFGVVFALVVVVIIAGLLIVVRSQAEADVDGMLRTSVETQLAQSASQQSDVFGQELLGVYRSVEALAVATQRALTDPQPAPESEVARFQMTPDGAYVTRDNSADKVSMMYTGFVPVGAKERQKAADLVAIDPTLRTIADTDPLVVQAYVNTFDSLNRIYPGFDVVAQYPPSMDISIYPFFYEADLVHNPGKGAVWTTAYVDPAGQGWMTSAISPVYVGDQLEAVAGVDVTVADLVGQILSVPSSFDAFSILVDASGVIIAMPPDGEALFGLNELTTVDYQRSIGEAIVKPEAFDINKRADTAELAAAMAMVPTGTAGIEINGTPLLAAWDTFGAPGPAGWRVLTMVPESSVRPLHDPGERMKEAAATTLWIVAFAFLALVGILTFRARRHSLAFTRPLEAIDAATARMAQGDFDVTLPVAPVAEIQRTGEQLVDMGRSLQTAQQRMLDDAERVSTSEQRYRAIFENVATPVITVGSDGVVIDSNDAAAAAFGGHVDGVDLGRVFPRRQWSTPGRRTVSVDFGDAGRRVLEIAVSVSGSGPEELLTIAFRDVTLEEQARKLLEVASATAERTSRMKDDFLASMSHEIRTPLNGVIGVLSLLADRDLPEDARHELAVARSSADDLLVLVNDVLDFAKIDAGQVTVELTDVRLFDVVESVRQLYSPLADEQRTTLAVSIDPDVPEWVRIDPTRVRQVLVNLVSNALKFTEDGRVEVFVHAAVEPDVESGSVGVLRFEVRDTGAGIDPALQKRLFTRFTQGDPTAARKFPGTGLGLAIVKRLTELMGGEVGLESTLGQGTTVWFTVLAEAGTPQALDRSLDDADADVPAGRLRVLVAEDNEVNRYLIVAILHRLGHEVIAVVNGREAVEAVQTQPFDLVLMDVQMPVANGIDATHAIRALPGAASRVPILAVTANVLPEQQARYRTEGFSGLVPKPLTLEQVERAIASSRSEPLARSRMCR